MRAPPMMVILDPDLEERTVAPSLDTYLNVVRKDGGPSRRSTSGDVAVLPTRSTRTPKASPSSNCRPSRPR